MLRRNGFRRKWLLGVIIVDIVKYVQISILIELAGFKNTSMDILDEYKTVLVIMYPCINENNPISIYM